MGLYFQVLASGSKGNSVLVCSERTRILVDAGLAGKELVRRLERTPVSAGQLDAILLTHEHQDHVRGAGVLSRRFGLAVHLSMGTMMGLPSQVGPLAYFQVLQPGIPFAVGDLHIQPFTTSHDAKEPVGLVIENEGHRLGICTDLGVATQLVKVRLQGCHGLVVEANHDMARLLNGPYPWYLKQRIRSRQGHLSNADTCDLLKSVHHEGLRCVTFAHLSEINNHPDLVLSGVQNPLIASDGWERVRFAIARQQEVTPGMELT